LTNGCVVTPIQHGFLEKLPETFDQVEIGGVRRQKNRFNLDDSSSYCCRNLQGHTHYIKPKIR
jgi:hypothetical protein